MASAKCRSDPTPGATIELGFLGSVLHVELPRTADEQQLVETSSFHEKFDPKLHVGHLRSLKDFYRLIGIALIDFGIVTCIITTSIAVIWRMPISSLVNMGMCYTLRTNINIWSVTCTYQSGRLVVPWPSPPGMSNCVCLYPKLTIVSPSFL